MSLVLQSSGGGQITIQEPATASNFTATLPATTGTLVVTGTTPTLNGVTFPATQVPSADANTLDDYEEGTFTPTYVASSGSITTYGTQLARYTKIGNTVFFELILSPTNIGSVSGQIKVGGLPFTPSSSLATNFSIFLGRVTNFNNAPLQGLIFGGDTNFELYKTTTGNNNVDLQGSDLANNCVIYASGFYQV